VVVDFEDSNSVEEEIDPVEHFDYYDEEIDYYD
jgi:hypothetical protein